MSSAPIAADFAMADGPLRATSTPPVNAPDAIVFHGSSLPRSPTKTQSNDEKTPPQIAKEPPSAGPFTLTASIAPNILCPLGEFLAPFKKCQIEPPMAPIANAAPTSSRIRSGHGSLL
eukprot:CAMPEP_0198737656 /NCGR_PEP_ID=MMETSP1475-20131203/67980_1 /TAXON_ID= ORGANISM="Unidentified sp., Strain CCMP1999" /NCGR_SAMPLE_ID=MMETSP1475 /ASSEMBLY_ACC=CAM_ASM_001111 /LENGTH=117 /DNA_ID=CAMNT_0044501525 /DNA_START=942 /DNA_END=1295 /DNA_ORIENTATION=+